MKGSAALAPALAETARMLARVASGKSLAEEFERFGDSPTETPRAALIDLAHGALRRYGRVQAIVGALARRGKPEPLVESLLWAALYAIDSGRYAEYTVVDQAVGACGLIERWNAKGFVNALLRAYLRQRPALEARIGANPEARYQHPLWWIELLRGAYAEAEADAILAAGNTHPPMSVRVNRRRIAPDAYAAKLEAAGIPARAVGAEALLLQRPVPVERLPGFAAGEVSVQDAGAQRAARCLDLADGQRVLDACAAPGGKSAHILETAEVALTALDADPVRCARVAANLERLGLQHAAEIRAADCTRVQDWWNGLPFDRVLADVPCSASGVARRHPDLKWLRRARDIPAFAARQGAILAALWHVLAPGGKLLYVTCSVFAQENEHVVQQFLARTGNARRMPLPDGAPAQWLPGDEHDGFYCALIAKQA